MVKSTEPVGKSSKTVMCTVANGRRAAELDKAHISGQTADNTKGQFTIASHMGLANW